jgi:TM2 domain-containing membrane protein YozV
MLKKNKKIIILKMLSLSFSDLSKFYRSCLRKGSWNNLSAMDKAFYIACMKLSKIRKIINKDIIYALTTIMKKLDSIKEKIMKKGKEVAEALSKSKTVIMIPAIKDWLRDPNYIFWLGLTYSNLKR